MSDVSFEPFGETLPAARRDEIVPSMAGRRIYRASIVAFWVLVVVVVVAARVAVATHGNIFAFGH